MKKMLVFERQPQWRQFLEDVFSPFGEITFVSSGPAFVKQVEAVHYDVIVLDLGSDIEKRLALIDEIRRRGAIAPVVVTSEADHTETTVRAIKAGAYDFVVKPFSDVRIRHVVHHALETRSLKNEIDYLRRQQDVVYDFDKIISVSPASQACIRTLKKFASSDLCISISGETGTGKSFLSGAVHFNSRRRKKPFIKINCANITENFLESELFGHEKGAFTGADKLRIGRFEQADGGTLFLDEIGEMSLNLQAKLLRVLEERTFERLGGSKTVYADVRLIAATNRNLEKMVEEGSFREDLYYRINVLSIDVPPLRNRIEDIEPLSMLLLAKALRTVNKRIDGFSPEVIDCFKRYSWPGNIRQLDNTIQRAVMLEESRIIRRENILTPEPLKAVESFVSQRPQSPSPRGDSEEARIIKALETCLWIQKDAARILGVSPRVLNYKIKKFNISHPRWRKNR
ncbi:acetoacetate metabolism transcriptional regulator AtoC [Desulfatiferula olefinivorans]